MINTKIRWIIFISAKDVEAIYSQQKLDQEIGVFRHVAQPTRLRLEFPRETGLILRFAGKSGKSGNPFQTKEGK